MTSKQGAKFNSPFSVAQIPSFIRFYNINTEEILLKTSPSIAKIVSPQKLKKSSTALFISPSDLPPHKLKKSSTALFLSSSDLSQYSSFDENSLSRETIQANFSSFNEFFYRKLKPEARLLCNPDDPTVAVSPADCRMNVFDTVDKAKELWIKGTSFTIAKLLGIDSNEALEWEVCLY